LRRLVPTEQVIARLEKVSGVRADLMALTKSRLLAGDKQYSKAAVVLAPLASDMTIPRYVRGQARLLRVQYLGRSGKSGEAIGELEKLGKDKHWRKFALLAKADLLTGARMFDRADAVLTELRAAAQEEQDAAMLRGVAARYLLIHRASGPRTRTQPKPAQPAGIWLTKAQAVCRQHEAMLPNDPRSHLLWARIWSSQGLADKRIEAYRKAVACQPSYIRTYLVLVSALDRADRCDEALEVLEDLEGVGQTASSVAILERGLLLKRLGLHDEASGQFQKLVKSGGYRENPRLRMYLARALVSVGNKPQARELLRGVPEHARYYGQARFLLVGLHDDEGKLKELEELAKKMPGQAGFLLARMRVLLKLDRPEAVAKAFGGFVDNYRRLSIKQVVEGGVLALQAQLKMGQRRKAANLCEFMYGKTRLWPWRHLAILLTIDDRPAHAREILPEADQAEMFESLLGLCLALQTKDAEGAGKWSSRFYKTGDKVAGPSSLRARFGPYRVLAKLAMSPVKPDKGEIKVAALYGRVSEQAIQELVSRPFGDERTTEVVKLIKASVAIDTGLADLGRNWAMEVLSARGTCQWAAAMVLRTKPDTETLGKVHGLIEPKDCRLGRVIRGSQLEMAKQYDEAAEMYRLAANTGEVDYHLIMSQAQTLQLAGRLDRAMSLYAKICRETRSPMAANNAANLAAQLYPKDAAKLTQARQWAELALRSAPNSAACLDTHGWVAFLQGRRERALTDLRRAVKGSPGDPMVHYHLGMAEAAGGSKQMAKWHLGAVAETAKRQKGEGKPLSPEMKKVVDQAAKALAGLK